MKIPRLGVAVLFLLVIASSSGAQEPYFAISSSKTYLPGETPSLQLHASGLESLEFRVYRVKDPIRFFENLREAHSFGGRGRPLPREKSFLESLRDFKRRWWHWVRNIFRAQFRPESRAVIRERRVARQQERLTAAERYPQVPILNPQQLVSVWRQPLQGSRYRWDSITVPVGVTERGVYLVEATDGNLRAYTILIITEIAMVTKSAPAQALVFLANRRTGAPVGGGSVLFRADNDRIATVLTDSSGIAETKLPEKKIDSLMLLARAGDDFTIQSPYAWYVSSDPERDFTGYVYTDRPVYRPGHIVHFKAIVRDLSGSEYRIPAVRDAQVEIQDPDGKPVFRDSLKLSSMGTLFGEYELPLTSALGYYSLGIKLGERQASGSFYVEEYRKPEFDVKVVPSRKRVLQGEPIEASIEARYYFGEPVASAKVTYVAHVSRYWAYPHEEEDEPAGEGGGEEGEEDYYYGGEQQIQTTGQLDAEGRLRISIPTRVSDGKGDLRYRIEARVTDQSNREIAGHASAIATYGSFFLTAQLGNYVYEPGARPRLRVEARDYDGRPVSTDVRIEVSRWRGREERREVVFSTAAKTDASGSVNVELAAVEAGSWSIRVAATTPENREVEDWTWMWVSGTGDWYGAERERIQIVPDKKSYRPGDVAKVLIISGAPNAHLLVTVEGRQIHSRQVIASTEATVTVNVPIRPEYAPNFYVSAVFLRDNRLYEGNKSLKVPPDAQRLQVEVQSSKPQYQPGEAAQFTVVARDYEGRPVAAEFSLGVVDEAIYAIRPDAALDPLNFFYARTYNRVNTDSSLTYYFYGQAGKRQIQLANRRTETTLAQIKPERETLVEPKVRKAFPDTIYWVADVKTDTNGRATARFSFPDSLTTFRATARGVTVDTKVGGGIQRTVVRKNLILRLATPRFFTHGDEVTISVIVHNYLATEKTARVSLSAEGLEILEGTARDVKVPSRSEVRLDWRIRANQIRDVKLLGRALTNEESDAMELTLPVNPYGVKMAAAYSGALIQPTAEHTIRFGFPADTVNGSQHVQISLTPSVAGAIFGALEYLTSYPYGCTEQTMSSFLPNVIVSKAAKELGMELRGDPSELQRKVRAGLDRIYDFQHEEGGWGWWKTDDSHLFMSAYVLSGLAQAQEAGYPVRDDVVQKGRNWLVQEFHKEKDVAADLRAYVLYALALTGLRDTNDIESVWTQRGKLSPYGLALLGLALQLAEDARTAEVASQLEASARQDASETYWALDADWLMGFYGDASPEATSFVMKFLSRVRPESPLLPKAALWLASHRSGGYYWYSTKQTAMVVFGLMDYLRLGKELHPDFQVNLQLNGRQLLARRFTRQDALAPVPATLRISAGRLPVAESELKIRKSGEGRLYWSVRAEHHSAQEKLANTGKLSLSLARQYFKLVPGKKEDRIVHRLEPLPGQVASGDIIAVRLTVSGERWQYLIIEDPIPAGTEFIQRDDLYELEDRPPWWVSWYTRREFHDDHAAFFETYFDRQREYVYLLKVVNPGKFRASPGRVEPMYQPQYFATSDSHSVEVQ